MHSDATDSVDPGRVRIGTFMARFSLFFDTGLPSWATTGRFHLLDCFAV